jgi:hypothetical protein
LNSPSKVGFSSPYLMFLLGLTGIKTCLPHLTRFLWVWDFDVYDAQTQMMGFVYFHRTIHSFNTVLRVSNKWVKLTLPLHIDLVHSSFSPWTVLSKYRKRKMSFYHKQPIGWISALIQLINTHFHVTSSALAPRLFNNAPDIWPLPSPTQWCSAELDSGCVHLLVSIRTDSNWSPLWEKRRTEQCVLLPDLEMKPNQLGCVWLNALSSSICAREDGYDNSSGKDSNDDEALTKPDQP